MLPGQGTDHRPALTRGERVVGGLTDELVTEQRDLLCPVLAGQAIRRRCGRHRNIPSCQVDGHEPAGTGRGSAAAGAQRDPGAAPGAGVRVSSCWAAPAHHDALNNRPDVAVIAARTHASVPTSKRRATAAA